MLPWIFKIHTLMESGPAVYEASVDISSKTTIDPAPASCVKIPVEIFTLETLDLKLRTYNN